MTTIKKELLQEIEESPDFLLEEVLSFLRVAKLSISQAKNNNNERPIWEIASEISQKIPDEEWQKLPKDLSKNLDHYLYGSPKNEE